MISLEKQKINIKNKESECKTESENQSKQNGTAKFLENNKQHLLPILKRLKNK